MRRFQLAAENEELISELETSESTQREYDNQVTERLKALDEVIAFLSWYYFG